jgi:dihydropteroate synthase
MAPELRWGERTYVMGILNVTPDSFSGDGLAKPGSATEEIVAGALEHARSFVAAGAEILDVGAESTRPRAAYGDRPEVDPADEAALAVPVVRALVAGLGERALVSIDTSRASVARAALEAGARIVNDVWAARRDPGVAEAVAAANAHLVLMHNQERIDYPDGVFDHVVRWLRESAAAAVGLGVARDRLIVDPGIGFGKGVPENLEILHRLGELKAAVGDLPLLVGTSRKRFLGELLGGAGPNERLEGTAATVTLAIAAGADVVRVHDVESICRTVRVSDAVVRR